jgi:hypothetical protein
MRRFALLLLPLAALAVAQGAKEQVDNRINRGFRLIRQANLRADLTFLTSEPLGGRLSMERGDEAAVQFIAGEFAKAGLRPVVPSISGPSYLQDVPMIEFTTDAKESALVLERADVKKRYEFSVDFSGAFPREVALRSQVVFAGYGITAPEYNYDDYAGLNVAGKIVLVLDHEPQEDDPKSIFNGYGNTLHANSRVKALNAQLHGAIAVLVMNEPNRRHPTNAERSARIPGGRQFLSRLPSQTLVDNEVRIPLFTVTDKLSNDLLATCGKKPSELQSSIDATLKPVGLALPETTVDLRLVIATSRRSHTTNVMGIVDGIDPKLQAETVIISAHHDHNGMRDGTMFPGADDNGSGTVGVIELARSFGVNGNVAKPKRSVMFIVFGAEERGLLGSYYYAAHPLRPLKTTRAVINFDMIGRNEAPSQQTEGLMDIAPDTSNELNFTGTVYSPEYRQFVEAANRWVGLKLNYKWENDAALNLFARSDQFPFIQKEVPGVWWFTGFHPDYHQSTDTVEKINFDKMEKILKLAYLTTWAIGDADTPPRFKADPRGK